MIRLERREQSSNGCIAEKLEWSDQSVEDLEQLAESDLPISTVARDLLDIVGDEP